MKVRAPDGRTWLVGRQWWPWRRRVLARPVAVLLLDGFGIRKDGEIWTADWTLEDLLVFFARFWAILITPMIALFMLVMACEVGLELLALPLALAGRAFLGRPWTVQVRNPDGDRVLRERVSGGSRARERRDELAARVQRGEQPGA